MSDKYIVVEDTAFAVDADEQIATAESALLAAGVQEAAVYYGEAFDRSMSVNRSRS